MNREYSKTIYYLSQSCVHEKCMHLLQFFSDIVLHNILYVWLLMHETPPYS